MEPLFHTSPDGTKVEPWLATGYLASADGLTRTITLRDSITFSDGARHPDTRALVGSIPRMSVGISHNGGPRA